MIAVGPRLADGETEFTDAAKAAAEGEGGPGARRPQGRQGLGRRSPSRVSTDPHQGPGRRPRLHRQGRRARRSRSSTPCSPPAPDTPDRGHRGRRRHVPRSAGSPTSSRRSSMRRSRSRSRTRASTSPTTGRRSGATSSAPSSATRSSPATSPPGPQREVSEIWHAGGRERGRRWRDQRPPHPLLAQRRPHGGVDRGGRRPGVGQGRGRTPGATYAKLKADPSQFDAIARAESDEDVGGHDRRQAAVLLDRGRRRPGVRRGDLRARPRARASSWSPSSRRSAGT